jgi:ABC-type uncharacterized transport system YnjBCD substrate-binding protein
MSLVFPPLSFSSGSRSLDHLDVIEAHQGIDYARISDDFSLPNAAYWSSHVQENRWVGHIPYAIDMQVFFTILERVPNPPKSAIKLLQYVQDYPWRFSYPEPPSSVGLLFLQQLLVEHMHHPNLLGKPVDSETFVFYTQDLWHYLDRLHQFVRPVSSEHELVQSWLTGILDIIPFDRPNQLSDWFQKGTVPRTSYMYAHSPQVRRLASLVISSKRKTAPRRAIETWLNHRISAEAQSFHKHERISVLDPSKVHPLYKSALYESVRHMNDLDNNRSRISWADGRIESAFSRYSKKGQEYSDPLRFVYLHPSWSNLLMIEWSKRYKNTLHTKNLSVDKELK